MVCAVAFSAFCVVAWWRHQMETFSVSLAFCAGSSSVTGEIPAKRPVTWSFDVFLDLRLHKRMSEQSWGWCNKTEYLCQLVNWHVLMSRWCISKLTRSRVISSVKRDKIYWHVSTIQILASYCSGEPLIHNGSYLKRQPSIAYNGCLQIGLTFADTASGLQINTLRTR